jgi:hypothetical protein
MSIRIECSSCGHAYQVAEQLSGKKVRCKHCKALIDVPGISQADPNRTHVDHPLPNMAEPPPRAEPEERAFDGVGDEEEDIETPELTPPPQGAGLHVLEILFPIAIAAGCLGWLVIASLMNDDTGHSCLGPFRAAVYLLIYVAIVFPLALRGTSTVGKKLYLPMPLSHHWKSFGIFCAPLALGSVLALSAESPVMPAVGAVLGLIISLGSFIFVFNLQPRHISRGLAIAGAYLTAGTVIAFAALYGINVLLLAILTASHSASDYPQSPLGSAYAWNPPPEQVVHHKSKPAPAPIESAENSNPATTAPSTQPSPEPATSVATTSPSPAGTAPSTQEAKAPSGPTTRPQTAPAESAESHPSAVALSPLLAAPPVTVMDNPALAVDFPSAPGMSAWVALRDRTAFGDELEVWTGPNWGKSQTITAQPKTAQDHGEIFLSPKANTVARLVNLPQMSVQVRPLTGDPATQEKATRVVDLEALVPRAVPDMLGFASTGVIAVLWHGNPDAIGLVDPQATSYSPLRSRLVQLTGTDNHLGNLALTPDTHFIVSVQHNPTLIGASGPSAGNYFVVDSMFGTEAIQHMAMTNLSADRSTQPLAGIRCSADGKRAAVLYVENGSGLIEVYHLPDGARITSHIFSGAPAQRITDYHGSAIDWMAGDSALLIDGRYVMDSQSFDLLGDLGIADVKGAYVVDRTTLALLISGEKDLGHCNVMMASLNSQKFPGLPNKPTPATNHH